MADCLRKMQMSDAFNKATNEDKVKAAEKELADYLETHPEMQVYQDKISDLLSNVGPDPMKRCEALSMLMVGEMSKLGTAWLDLHNIVKKLG
jgi:heme oxygenase